jgi:hypothetical protein
VGITLTFTTWPFRTAFSSSHHNSWKVVHVLVGLQVPQVNIALLMGQEASNERAIKLTNLHVSAKGTMKAFSIKKQLKLYNIASEVIHRHHKNTV